MLNSAASFAAAALIGIVVLLAAVGSRTRSLRLTSRRAAVLAAFAVIAVLSCGRETTAPDGAAVRIARGLSFVSSFPSLLGQLSASNVVAFTRVRVVLRHPDGTVALDTTVNFGSGSSDEMTLSLSVRLQPSAPASGESLALNLAYVNAAGDTVFRGGPIAVLVVPSRLGDPAPPPVQVAVRYSGTGSNAASVRIAPRTLSVTAGDNFTFTAAALDGTGTALPNTPIVWASLDPSVALITASGAGAGTTLPTRGPARITAQLLTGQADTVTLTVLPKLSALVSVSGNSQSGPGDVVLAAPVVVRANATDGQPMAGVPVTFTPSTGGSVGAASVTTDASGLAQTTWRLAPTLGAQTLTATASGVATLVTFGATATSGPAAKLAITTQPNTGTAGAVLDPVVVTVKDALGNTSASYTGTVTMTFGANPGGGVLSGTTTATAVAGVATFPALRIRQAATGYTLVASAASLASATTNTFAVTAAPASTLALVSGAGQGGFAGSTLPDPIVVIVSDSVGNPVAGKTVTFSAAGDGSVSPASAVTGANGTASTKWTLGSAVGFQLMNVAGTGLTPNPLGVGASAAPLAQLQFVAQPNNATAGVLMSPPITVRGINAAGATDTLFSGNVTLAFGSNPSGATLAGTLTVAAYRGVATFSTLRVRKAGSGYTLAASASGWGSATSTSFNIAAAPAASVAVSSGNAQTGPTSAALTTPLVALVTDSTGNPVSGVTVTWSTTGGSLSPASSTTNASGLASSVWTLGPAGGAQSASATVSPLTPASFTATAVAPPAAYSKTWTGATSTDWAVASNWSPVGAPSASDSTLIPAVTSQPLLSALSNVGNLTVASGATVNLGGFELDIYGNVDSQGSITGSAGSFVWVKNPLLVAGNFSPASMYLPGGATLSGNTTVTGTLQMTGLSMLNVNSKTLTVNGNATLALSMINAADSVNVTGTFTVNTGQITPNLTAGTIVVGGNFVQQGNYQTFQARGTHKVVMKGSSQQHIQFYRSTNRASHFNDLVIDNAAGVVADSVNFDNGGGSDYGGITEVGRHLTILNGTLSGVRGGYLRLSGTLTDPVGGRLTIPKVYFDSSATPISGTTPTISVPNMYFDGYYQATTSMGGKRVVLGGNLTVNGNLNIQGGDTLKLNGHTLTVNGMLTQAYIGGMLELSSASDVLNVSGDMSLQGYPHSGIFTAGTINAGGAFAASSFRATGTNKVVLKGAGSFYVYAGAPDSVSGAYFNDLEIANTAADTLMISGSVLVRGMLTKTTVTPTVFSGVQSGSSLGTVYANGINITQSAVWNRVPLYLYGSGSVTFGNSTFNNNISVNAENPGLGGIQEWHLTVNRPAGSYTFDGLTFSLTSLLPTPGGNPWGFVNVVGPASVGVTLTNATPTAAGGGTAKSTTSGGATLSWSP